MSAGETTTAGEIVTFYSYKGGTGRSMALANVACLLAEQLSPDEHILMIDWDLEARVLHRYFRGQLEAEVAPGVDRDAATDYLPGLIEYFEAIAVELDRAGSAEFSRPIAEAAFAHGDLSKYTI